MVKTLQHNHYLAIDETTYIKYSNFKSRVLLTAEKELTQKADIMFTFEEFKTGRRISDIGFTIIKNNKNIHNNKIIEYNNKLNKPKKEVINYCKR